MKEEKSCEYKKKKTVANKDTTEKRKKVPHKIKKKLFKKRDVDVERDGCVTIVPKKNLLARKIASSA